MNPRCLCGGKEWTTAFTYDAPPAGEVRFQFSAVAEYRREVLRCPVCSHFVSVHAMDDTGLYREEYVSANYGRAGIHKAFERIVSLPPEQSDNVGRVRRILDFAGHHLAAPAREGRAPTVLDVGSGLCVFLHRMKTAGWDGTALDRDPRLVAHAQDVVGVRGICGDFAAIEDVGQYDVVTFNKVLEHVKDPIGMLARAVKFLHPGGLVYVEVPDGEAAVHGGPGREEFFIDHHHVFSAASLALLAARAGLNIRVIERLREPSTKFTLRGFLIP